jgi:hypothetical protein
MFYSVYSFWPSFVNFNFLYIFAFFCLFSIFCCIILNFHQFIFNFLFLIIDLYVLFSTFFCWLSTFMFYFRPSFVDYRPFCSTFDLLFLIIEPFRFFAAEARNTVISRSRVNAQESSLLLITLSSEHKTIKVSNE